MKLKFIVDRTRAMLEGIDAPSATAAIEIDPALLTKVEREVLAKVAMQETLDCTKYGVCPESETLQRSEGYKALKIEIVSQTLDGVRLAIREILDRREENLVENRKKAAAITAELDARYLAAMTDTTMSELELYWSIEGKKASEYDTHKEVQRTITCPSVKEPSSSTASGYGSPSPEIKTKWNQYVVQKEAERAAMIETLLPGVREEVEQLQAARAAKQAQEKAEYDSVYARLPQALRDRDAGGFASKSEISDAMADMIRADAGFEDSADTWERECETSEITDEEYAALKKVTARLPSGANVQVMHAWDFEDQESDDEDEDGPASSPTNMATIALITWSHGGLKIRARVVLN